MITVRLAAAAFGRALCLAYGSEDGNFPPKSICARASQARTFASLRRRLPIFVCSETRMKLRDGLYLLPDVAVFWTDRPGAVPDSPPLVAIVTLGPAELFDEQS